MNLKQFIRSGLALMLFSGIASLPVSAEPLFFGPSPYLSQADIPTGFYAGGSPSALENFEDRKLDSPFTASAGGMLAVGSLTDSVDADDGTLDGSGSSGVSWYYGSGSTGVTFTFSGLLPTAAGLVWTDGWGTTTFEAFGPGMVSLGKTGPVLIADGSFTGTTADDRFFGVQDLDGILALRLTNTSGGIEIDHVQYGSAQSSAIPEPSVFCMLMIGTVGLYFHNRQKKREEGAVPGDVPENAKLSNV